MIELLNGGLYARPRRGAASLVPPWPDPAQAVMGDHITEQILDSDIENSDSNIDSMKVQDWNISPILN